MTASSKPVELRARPGVADDGARERAQVDVDEERRAVGLHDSGATAASAATWRRCRGAWPVESLAGARDIGRRERRSCRYHVSLSFESTGRPWSSIHGSTARVGRSGWSGSGIGSAAGAERGDQGDHERPDPEGSVDGHRWAAGPAQRSAFVTPVTTRIAMTKRTVQRRGAPRGRLRPASRSLAGEHDDGQLAGGGQ